MSNLQAVMAQHGITVSLVEEYLERARGLTVGVAGENIIDEYVQVAPEGRSMKASIVTFRELGRQEYPGGVNILKVHLEQICKTVVLGSLCESLRKTRFIEMPFVHKVFSVVGTNEVRGQVNLESAVDFWVVADFGHGLFQGPQTSEGKFLALTVQSNSLNWGFNLAPKWKRADYLVIDRDELHLALGRQHGDIREMMQELVLRMGLKLLAVTLGHEGCLVMERGGSSVACPALTEKVVDRMGAGDAFLAATAPLAFLGAPLPMLALIGNLAGAFEVEQLGNVPLNMDYIHRRLACHES